MQERLLESQLTPIIQNRGTNLLRGVGRAVAQMTSKESFSFGNSYSLDGYRVVAAAARAMLDASPEIACYVGSCPTWNL